MARTITPPSLSEIQDWGATTDLVQAGRALGIGRTKSYELAQADKFPVRVIRIGRMYRVAVSELVAFLTGSADAQDVA